MSLRKEIYRGRTATPVESTPVSMSPATPTSIPPSARDSPACSAAPAFDGPPHWVRAWYCPPLGKPTNFSPDGLTPTTNANTATPTAATTPIPALTSTASPNGPMVKTWIVAPANGDATLEPVPTVDLSQWTYSAMAHGFNGSLPLSHESEIENENDKFKAAVSHQGETSGTALFGSSAPIQG